MSQGRTLVSKYIDMNYLFPFSGAGVDVPVGAFVQAGLTAGTNVGVAIPGVATAGDATNFHIGVLGEMHDFSVSGDATTQTLVTWFPGFGAADSACPSHAIQLGRTANVVKLPYDLTSTVTVTSATSTVISITSAENSLDGGFIYVNAGTGIGQLEFIKSSTTSDITVIAAMTTTLGASSRLTKVLPHFHQFPTWLVNTTVQGTQLASQAAVGTGRGVNLGSFIVRNGLESRLDPKAFNNTQSLNSLASFELYSFYVLNNSIFSPIA